MINPPDVRAGLRRQRAARQGGDLQPDGPAGHHRPDDARRRRSPTASTSAPSTSWTRRANAVADGSRRAPARRARRRGDDGRASGTAARPARAPNGALYFPYLKTTDPLTGTRVDVAAQRLRRRHLRAGRHQPRRLEGAGRARDDDPQHDRRRRLGRDDRPAAGRAQPARRQLPAHVPRHRHRGVRRADARVRQPGLRAVELRRRCGAWRCSSSSRSTATSAGRSSSPTTRRCGTRSTQEVNAFMLGLFRQGAFQGATPSEAFQVQCDARRRRRPTSTTAS